MADKNRFDWVPFYRELANKLLHYKDVRQSLVKKVRQVFETAQMDLPTLDKDNNLTDIDPFTVFALFNKTSVKESNRKKIVRAVAQVFSIQAAQPTSFDGIPLVNPMNATYYLFSNERGEDDMDELWGLFETALAYAGDPTQENKQHVSRYFDLTINKKGNGNSKITMGLYWIAPDVFMNLDSKNEWYIYDSGKIPAEFVQTLPKVDTKISSSKYFEILDKMRAYLQSNAIEIKNFMELSFAAWTYAEEVNENSKKEKGGTDKKGSALADENVRPVHYWIYSPGDNASYWDEFYNDGIMAIGWEPLGDLSKYSSKEDMKQKMRECIDPDRTFIQAGCVTWEFVKGMKPGDIVFAKKGMHQVIGRGEVLSDYEYDPEREHYPNVRRVKWTDKGNWPHPGQAVQKTLTDITPYTEYVDKLKALFENDDQVDSEPPAVEHPVYDAENFLNEVYMDRESYETLVGLVKNKKNVILQGAPGVGKTFAAKRLAYSMMGEKDPDRVMMVQFHQSYSYEDFIMGFRPSESGFELRKGVFYNFCKTAEEDSDNDYFFIIDEINRGNLSKIFGELFMLIENDKRDTPLQLLYSNEKFSVPGNVYIIGMMNTADRSLAMLDYALRRRFAFFDMKTALDSEGFRRYRMELNNDNFDNLISCVERLNEDIENDESLGEGFCIGHSYFCNFEEDTVTEQALSAVVEYELIPLLKEYWFDEPQKVKTWSDALRSAVK